MFLRRLNRRGQSTAEYAILFALIVAVAIGIQVLVRRGLQGRVRDAVNYTGNDVVTGVTTTFSFTGDQYEPYYLDSSFTVTRTAEGTEEVKTGGEVIRTLTGELGTGGEISTRVGYQEFEAPE